ncbi:hypothetical protein [Paenirhodobacter hankyongi]|uniref:Response regulator n=1 Tax=Paenirhodobacter hankyongi TaxID=2294033 RepID=A0A421BRS2_9RHOB|nr:hypothetical protein [Sinirhodobacter hankyongi]RLL70994.1 hypothetical protein DYS74_07100 [Sinirhodobacter hankyongi]
MLFSKGPAGGRPHSGAEDESPLSGRRILVVEPSQSLPLALRGVSGVAITIVPLAAIDATLIARTAPDVVLSPLVCPEHDILDLARLLEALGYHGALRAYSAPLPNPRLILAEVRQIWHGGNFDILELPPELG